MVPRRWGGRTRTLVSMIDLLGRSARGRCLAGAVVAATLAWSVTLLVIAHDPAHAQLLSNVGLVVSPIAAGVGALLRSRRCAEELRTFWRLLGAAALSWGLGQAVWTWYESILGQDVPFPSPADLGYLGMAPLAAGALLSLPLAAPSLAGRVRTIIDGLTVAASLMVVSWIVVLRQILRSASESQLLEQAISLAYPVGDVVVITIVLYTALRVRQCAVKPPVSLPLVGTGLVAFAVADSGFSYLTATNAYRSGNGIDIGWFVGYALILVAAIRPSMARDTAEDGQLRAPLGTLFPSVAVILALGTSVVELVRTGHPDAFVSWVRTLIMVLLVARQVLTLRENKDLTQHLEQRVEERTTELAASRERFSALVQHSSDVVTVVDTDGLINYQSMSCERLFGYHPDELQGTLLTDLMDPQSAQQLRHGLLHAAAEPLKLHTLRTTYRHADGSERDVELTITNLLHNDHVRGLVLNGRDVTAQTTLEAELLYQAFHDSLTGLANRALFRDRLGHSLARRQAAERTVAVLFLDLDGFKEINDTLGHSSGDELLVHVAERLRSQVRACDTVARFGGDEFAILLDETEDADSAQGLAERIGMSLTEPFTLASGDVHVSASVGIATSTDDRQETAEQLLRNADLAMYQAKASDSSSFAVYDPAMHASLVERVQMEADLRLGLERDEFVVHYQPLIDLKTGQIMGSEALVRWLHPRHGLVSPVVFIPLAESSGLIRALGLWVLRQACEETVLWQRSSPELRNLKISVNVSARQLPDPALFGQVRDILEETGLEPSCLTLEMTESVLMESSDEIRHNLEALRTLGVRLAIDDFGTGYSSLSYLHRFPVDTLKIDRSFIEQLRLGGDAALVNTIVRLGQTMQLETVAEGIELAEEMLMLRRQGCTTGQGFHFSPPVTVDSMSALLREQTDIAYGGGELSA